MHQELSPFSEQVQLVLTAGGSTQDLLIGLIATDPTEAWSRIHLHTLGLDHMREMSEADPDPAENDWNGFSLTETAQRCVRVAQEIASDYSIDPMPSGVLALGLLAHHDTAAAKTLRIRSSEDQDSIVERIQDDVIGSTLADLDLSARWAATAPLHIVPPVAPEPVVAGTTQRRRLVVAAAALIFVAGCGIGLRNSPVPDQPGPAPHEVLLPDDGLGSRYSVASGPARASSLAPGSPAEGERRCDRTARRWTKNAPATTIEISVIACRKFVRMANVHFQADANLRKTAARVTTADIPYALAGQAVRPDGQNVSTVLFRRGQYLVHVYSIGSSRPADQDRQALEIAKLQWATVPGTAGPPLEPFDSKADVPAIGLGSAALILALLAALNIFAAVRSRRSLRRAESLAPVNRDGVTWLDVGQPAKTMATHAQIRFWFWMTVWGVAMAVPISTWFKGAISGLCTMQLVLSRQFRPGAKDLWGVYAAPQVKGKRSLATVTTTWTAHAVSMVAMFAVFSVATLWMLRGKGYVGTDLRFAPPVVADDAGIGQLLRRVPIPWLSIGGLALTLALASLAATVIRRTRRMTALDVAGLQQVDTRDDVLYLRNFADDQLTIYTSPITRRSMDEKFGLAQVEPFEELIVRYLSPYGPVIAISDPRVRGTQLGAARESLPADDWRSSVVKKIASSQLIVVGATPVEATAGLRWELDTIARCQAVDRTILLFAPRGAHESGSHWSRFREMTPLDLPAHLTEFADRILAMCPDGKGGWLIAHAERRTDWAYALAMSQLAETILGRTDLRVSGTLQ
ncbi:hypothetical protein [Kribbella speibonae]|uniref:Uncharacterized protein n=1 Tax=Kribbella speibonae TaxID=1572660 RepID=A0A4R0IXN5_9ACTN|nr:hypothetical protein [Kribbella speibonae]TCC36328.1 hypothetical protein E0H92_27135 [Kribbella speibonae]